ncbi:c-type cytochrome biogenesis protein CcsB [Protaetiibacter mangrovi]|uniref:C-type cytochrome biogenesis protein CcsB n=1 Tax=Protaetiibacter mangrovi TaxID=2970926 RepID=A0ABT1ZGF3_9MICO|nr:c-type cytochrome biogenesis protein CcsB [Protaetiibacter mangrovi]MCS0499735.1 c-type cytochrome biogenesis protein CcsB [Protaetiibacter mangrovi]TPX05861.1 c-type cytochrome biogenesis protein CcsB [Schumannella luteola]
MTTATLAAYSLLAVYSAAAVYVLAFIGYVVDLSGRSSRALAAQPAASASVASTTGTTTVLAPPAPPTAAPEVRDSRAARVAFALTVLGFVIHVLALVLRGIAAARAPWANMFEFAVTGTAVIVGVYLAVNIFRNVRYVGAYITGLVSLLLMLATINVYVDVVPLPPALQSGWLVIHVFVAILGTGFFALGAGLSIAQLLQARRETGATDQPRFLRGFPSSEALENTAYRVNVIGFAFWTFTLIAGAIWAEHAWGRYWGWDTKEVWTFIIWVVFAGYIHARATRGWRGAPSAWLAIVGFAAVLFNFTVVNLFFKGLHAYSGL